MKKMELNDAKAAQLIAYIASKTDIGKTKLMKLLYLIDFTAYTELGTSITNDTYVHKQWGPVPNGIFHRLDSIIGGVATKSLENRGGDNSYEKYTAIHGEGALRNFSAQEIAIIDGVLNEYAEKSRDQLVTLTHEEIPWSVTNEGEEIPYFLAPYRDYKKPTKEEAQAVMADTQYMKSLYDSYSTFVKEQEGLAVEF